MIGNEIFLKYIKVKCQIESVNMWNDNTFGVNNTSTRLNLYLISPRSGTPLWPTSDVQYIQNGFKMRFKGEWLP